MTDKRALDDGELDGLFAAARSAAPVPSDDLIARILADAEALAVVPVVARSTPGFFASLLAGIGGWPAAAGLMTATVVGLAFGLGAPDTVDSMSGGYFSTVDSSYQLEDLLPSYGDLLGEG